MFLWCHESMRRHRSVVLKCFSLLHLKICARLSQLRKLVQELKTLVDRRKVTNTEKQLNQSAKEDPIIIMITFRTMQTNYRHVACFIDQDPTPDHTSTVSRLSAPSAHASLTIVTGDVGGHTPGNTPHYPQYTSCSDPAIDRLLQFPAACSALCWFYAKLPPQRNPCFVFIQPRSEVCVVLWRNIYTHIACFRIYKISQAWTQLLRKHYKHWANIA